MRRAHMTTRTIRLGLLLAVAAGTGGSRAAYADHGATLAGPDSAPAGSDVTVTWTGPGDGYDYLAVFPPAAPPGAWPAAERSYATRSPLRVDVPIEPGEYELRYVAKGVTLARRKLVVTPVTASLKVAPTAIGGTSTGVVWSGPNNHNDHLLVVPVGTPERTSVGGLVRWIHGVSPTDVTVPEKPGEYEIRYVTGTGAKT